MNADVALGDPAAVEQAVELFTKMTPLRGRPGLAIDVAAPRCGWRVTRRGS